MISSRTRRTDLVLRNLIVDSLDELAELRLRFRRTRNVRVVLRLPLGGKDGRRERLEHRINRCLAACGCNEGTIAGLSYLILVPTVVMGRYVARSFAGWTLAGCGFIAALLIGKVMGLQFARWRLFRALRELESLARRHAKGM